MRGGVCPPLTPYTRGSMSSTCRAVALLLLLTSAFVAAVDARQTTPALPPLLASARQLIVVTTPGWDAVGGELRRC